MRASKSRKEEVFTLLKTLHFMAGSLPQEVTVLCKLYLILGVYFHINGLLKFHQLEKLLLVGFWDVGEKRSTDARVAPLPWVDNRVPCLLKPGGGTSCCKFDFRVCFFTI